MTFLMIHLIDNYMTKNHNACIIFEKINNTTFKIDVVLLSLPQIIIHMKSILLLLIYLFFHDIFAQVASPAAPQTQKIALSGADIHLGNGNVIDNGVIAFERGKIGFVGAAVDFTEQNYEIRDMKGQHIYPALILANTDLGLNEISAVKATRDYSEVGAFTPNVQSFVAFDTDSEIPPTLRSNGILLAQVTPRGGFLAGRSSIMQLDAWNWEDGLYHKTDGQHFRWVARRLPPRWWLSETEYRENKDYAKQVQTIKTFFNEAAGYAQNPNPTTKNQKLEAMKCVFDGSCNMYLHANKSYSIVEGIQFLKGYGIKNIVLVGGNEAYQVKSLLKENNIPVILSNVHRLPTTAEEDINMPYQLAALLTKEGILVGLSYAGTANARNLAFSAGNTVSYGLSKEEALMTITGNLAKIFKIDDRTGTLEKGKDANIIVSSGDVLDMRGNEITHAFIQGRSINLTNKHKKLYKKFKEKYGYKDE